MKEKEVSECKIKYFKDISQALNVQQPIDMIQYGDKTVADGRSLLTSEKVARERMVYTISKLRCNTKETVKIFEQYGRVMQSLYFKIGVFAYRWNYCQSRRMNPNKLPAQRNWE